MGFLRHIIGLLAALLLSALGAVAMPMMPTASHQAELLLHQEAFVAEHTDVHFAARAPPLTAHHGAFTGAAVAERGIGFPIRGCEAHVASLSFSADFDAPNSTLPDGYRFVDDSVGAARPTLNGGNRWVIDNDGNAIIQRPDGTFARTQAEIDDLVLPAPNNTLFRVDDFTDGFENPEQLNRILNALDQQGVTVIVPDGQADDLLRFMEYAGVQGSLRNTGNGTFDLTLRPDAGPSAVFEELIHLGQHRTGRFAQWASQHGTAGATALAEYDAATRLVRNQTQYGISDAEHAINLQRVQDFASDLDRFRIPYD